MTTDDMTAVSSLSKWKTKTKKGRKKQRTNEQTDFDGKHVCAMCVTLANISILIRVLWFRCVGSSLCSALFTVVSWTFTRRVWCVCMWRVSTFNRKNLEKYVKNRTKYYVCAVALSLCLSETFVFVPHWHTCITQYSSLSGWMPRITSQMFNYRVSVCVCRSRFIPPSPHLQNISNSFSLVRHAEWHASVYIFRKNLSAAAAAVLRQRIRQEHLLWFDLGICCCRCNEMPKWDSDNRSIVWKTIHESIRFGHCETFFHSMKSSQSTQRISRIRTSLCVPVHKQAMAPVGSEKTIVRLGSNCVIHPKRCIPLFVICKFYFFSMQMFMFWCSHISLCRLNALNAFIHVINQICAQHPEWQKMFHTERESLAISALFWVRTKKNWFSFSRCLTVCTIQTAERWWWLGLDLGVCVSVCLPAIFL